MFVLTQSARSAPTLLIINNLKTEKKINQISGSFLAISIWWDVTKTGNGEPGTSKGNRKMKNAKKQRIGNEVKWSACSQVR